MPNLPANETYITKPSSTLTPRSLKSLSKGLIPTGNPFQAPKAPTREASEALEPAFSTPLQPHKDVPRYQPIPKDYFGFQAPGTYSDPETGQPSTGWISPSAPEISTLKGFGQYVIDKGQPGGNIIKSKRAPKEYTREERRLLLRGLPPDLFQIDHMIPLWLGGGDTLANKQVLENERHDLKTRAQAVPYTLLGSINPKTGKPYISVNQAMAMALTWEQKDLVDLPPVDEDSGFIPIQDALDIAQHWEEQARKKPGIEGLKGFLSAVPGATSEMFKGTLPDWIRAPLKGAVAGFTGGLVPAAPDQDASTTENLLYGAGVIGGALIPIGYLAKGLGYSARAIGLLRSASRTAASKAGFKIAEKTVEKTVSETAGQGLKTLGKKPSLLDTIDMGRVGRFAGAGAIYGQMTPEGVIGSTIANTLPYGEELPEERAMGRFFEDLGYGVLAGAASPTLKGVAMTFTVPVTWELIKDPEDYMGALTTGGIFAGLQLATIPGSRAALSMAKGKSTVPFKPDTKFAGFLGDPALAVNMEQQIDDAATRAANNFLVQYTGAPVVTQTIPLAGGKGTMQIGRRILKDTDAVPPQSDITYEQASALTMRAKEKAIQQLAAGEIDLPQYSTTIKRIIASGRQLYKRGLPYELRKQADIDDMLSFGKIAKEITKTEGGKSVDNIAIPSVAGEVIPALRQIDDTILSNSLRAHDADIPSGKFPVGRGRISGMADENPNPAALDGFITALDEGKTAPFLAIIDRGDLEQVFKEISDKYPAADIKANRFAKIEHPENSGQVIGFIRNEDGTYNPVNLGWEPRLKHILPASQGGVKYSFGSRLEQLGAPHWNIRTDMNKDIFSQARRKEGVRVLIANIDRRAQAYGYGKESGKPYMHYTINDENWILSKKLEEWMRNSGTGQKDSMQAKIAETKNALNAKQKTAAVTEVRRRITAPADRILERADEIKIDDVDIAAKIMTTNTLSNVRQLLENVQNPIELKNSMRTLFGISLDDAGAAVLFNRREILTVRETTNFIAKSIRDGKTDGRIDTIYNTYLKPFFTSAAYKKWNMNQAFPELRILGGIKKSPGTILPPTTQMSLLPQRTQPTSPAAQAPSLPSVSPAAPPKYDGFTGKPIISTSPQTNTPVATVSATQALPRAIIPDSPAAPVSKPTSAASPAESMVTQSGVRLSKQTNPDGTFWLEQNTKKASEWSRLAQQGHKIEHLMKGGRGGYAGKIRIDGTEYTYDQARAKFGGRETGQTATRLLQAQKTGGVPPRTMPPSSSPSQEIQAREIRREQEGLLPYNVDRYASFSDVFSKLNPKSPLDAVLETPVAPSVTGPRSFAPLPPVSAPRADEVFQTIDNVIRQGPDSPGYLYNKTLHDGLEAAYGKNYRTDPEVRNVLENNKYFTRLFGQISEEPRESTQVPEAMAAYLRGEGGQRIFKERAQLQQKADTGDIKAEVELRAQREKDIKDLTPAEKRGLGLPLESKESEVQAARGLLIGSSGLIKTINVLKRKSGKPSGNASQSTFANLVNQAKKYDAEKQNRLKRSIPIEDVLIPLQQRFNALKKALETAPDIPTQQALDDVERLIERLGNIVNPTQEESQMILETLRKNQEVAREVQTAPHRFSKEVRTIFKNLEDKLDIEDLQELGLYIPKSD